MKILTHLCSRKRNKHKHRTHANTHQSYAKNVLCEQWNKHHYLQNKQKTAQHYYKALGPHLVYPNNGICYIQGIPDRQPFVLHFAKGSKRALVGRCNGFVKQIE